MLPTHGAVAVREQRWQYGAPFGDMDQLSHLQDNWGQRPCPIGGDRVSSLSSCACTSSPWTDQAELHDKGQTQSQGSTSGCVQLTGEQATGFPGSEVRLSWSETPHAGPAETQGAVRLWGQQSPRTPLATPTAHPRRPPGTQELFKRPSGRGVTGQLAWMGHLGPARWGGAVAEAPLVGCRLLRRMRTSRPGLVHTLSMGRVRAQP